MFGLDTGAMFPKAVVLSRCAAHKQAEGSRAVRAIADLTDEDHELGRHRYCWTPLVS
jgi:hypothetical protein